MIHVALKTLSRYKCVTAVCHTEKQCKAVKAPPIRTVCVTTIQLYIAYEAKAATDNT